MLAVDIMPGFPEFPSKARAWSVTFPRHDVLKEEKTKQ
jgi:hypothetical protein